LGVHWLFQPVIDLNIDPMNPETNVRAFGDDESLVRKLALAQIKGLQQGGVAATAKHFPGAGMDDRDQHLCTSLNPLPLDAWAASYGKVWRAAIKAGVLTVMPGHIALPDYEDLLGAPAKAMPATLNPKLLQELLREELGFQGVIVSDAAPMIGISSRVKAEDMAVEFIRAGGDVFLFAEPVDDFKRLMAAVKAGRLGESRVYESARRVLELKAALGLHKSVAPVALDKKSSVRAAKLSDEIAESSATIMKGAASIPAKLKKGDKVLTVTIKWPGADEFRCPELKVVDEELKKLGLKVDHLLNPSHKDLREAVDKYKRVYINVIQLPHALIGNIRMIGPMIMPFWRAFYAEADNCVFTSFGSPYLLYEQPHWPNLLVLYSPSEASQRAAVKVWTGKLKAKGEVPFHS
jgi:beta-N-acetylhexosaminidase